MTGGRRRAVLVPFAVDDGSIQLTWRHLRPGTLRLRVADVARELAVGAGPGSVVLAGLPPGRLLTVHASGDALPAPRRLAVRTLARLPGEELCRVATISDLHLGAVAFGQQGTIRERPRPEVLHPQRCAAAAVDEAVAWGAQHLFAKGDLTNLGQPDQWRDYAALVHRAPVPFDAIPGNHDQVVGWYAGALAPDDAAKAFGLSIADPVLVRDLPGLRVVLADSTVNRRHGGTLRRATEELVAAVADADRAGGVLVLVHHQLQPHVVSEGWPTGIPKAESFALLERLGAVHPHVLVSSGHTHRHRRWGHAGVTATQVGSTKDYPGVWAGYVAHEGGLRQIVRRVAVPDCLAWTDHSRRAALGAWSVVAPGRLDARCFDLTWPVPGPGSAGAALR